MGDSPVSQVSPVEDDQEMGDISSLARKLDSEFDNAQQPETKTYDPNSDHMKVYLRIRPHTETEKKLDEDQGCYEINSIHTLSAHAPKESHTYKTSTHGLCKSTHKFTFSHIFPEETSQKEFFDETMLGTVKDFINGQNCLVFTYGVTNSGKTYTIQGNPKDGGVLPRALDVVFNSIEGKHWDGMSIKPEMYCDVRRLSTRQEEIEIKTKECVLKLANDNDPDVGALLGPDAETSKFNIDSSGAMSEDSLMPSSDRQSTSSEVSKTEDWEDKDGDNKEAETLDNRVRDEGAVNVEDQGPIKFSIWVSFVEVYNEQIFDLLEPLPKKKKGRRTVLSLREDKNGSPYVKGVKEICVTSADEAYKVLTVGQKNLQMACTKMNHNSSRSHCIFNIKMVRVVDTHNPHMARVSMLSLCDLAGSERYTKTQSQGDRIKEAGNINTSLLTLGKCIKELRHNQHYKDHQRIVPFRESKLTRLFQSFLCGRGKASMIVNINMCASMFDETLYALKYSAVAKQVIVVQAPPPPPVENKKHKKSRAVSLALAPTPKGAVRPSISWATPRTMAQLAEIESEAAGVPLPIDEEEDELDTTLAASREQELQEMIQTLGDMLKEEKRKNITMESRIREEVCKEMSQHLVEIEKTYNDMIEEERERAGRWAEARVEMYMRSVKKKSTKRKKREDDDEEEEMVPLSQHNAQLAKLQDQAGQIADLQDSLDNTQEEIKQLQDALKAATSEREAAQGQLSQLNFEVANLKEVTEKSDSKALNKSLCELSQSEIVRSLTQHISQLKQELEEKIAENGELNEMLTEAGETFQAKEAQIRTLEAQVAAGTPKKGSDQTLEDVTRQLGQVISKLADTEEQLDSKTSETETLKKKLEEATKAVQDLQDISKEKESLSKKLMAVESELSTLKSGFQERQAELGKMKLKQKDEQELQGQVVQLTADNTKLNTQLKKAKESLTVVEAKNKKLEESVKEHSTVLSDNEIFIAELNKQVKTLKAELEVKHKEIEEDPAEADMDIIRASPEMKKNADTGVDNRDNVEGSIKALTDQLEGLQEILARKSKDLSKESRRSCELELKINGLEESLKQANEEIRKRAGEVTKHREQAASHRNEVQKLRDELQRAKGDLTKVSQQASKVDAKYQKILQEKLALQGKISSVEKVHKKMTGNASENNAKITDLQNELDDYIFRVNEQAIENGDMKDQMAENAKAHKETKSQLNELQKEKAKLNENIIEKEAIIIGLKNKVTNLESQMSSERKIRSKANGQLDELLQSKAVLIEELNTKVETLSRQMNADKLKHKETVSKLEEVEKQIQQVQQNFEAEKTRHEATKEKWEADVVKYKKQLETSQSDLRDIQHEYFEATGKLDSLQMSIEALQEAADASKEHSKVAQEKEDQLASVTKTLEEQRTANTDMQCLVEELKSQVEDHQRQKKLDDAKRRHSDVNMVDLAAKVKELERQLVDAELKAASSSKQQTERRTADQALEQSQTLVAQQEEEIKHLKSELRKVDSVERELKQKASTEEACNTAALAKYQKQVSDLEDVVRDLEACLCSSKNREKQQGGQVDKLRNKCHDLEREIIKREDQIQELETELTVGKTVKKAEREVQELQTQLSRAEASLRTKTSKVDELHSKIAEMEESLEDEKRQNDMEKRRLQNKLESATENYNMIKVEKEESNKRLSSSDARLKEQERNLKNVQAELSAVQSSLQEKEADLEQAMAEVSSKNGNLKQLKKEHKSLKEELETTKCEVEAQSSKLNRAQTDSEKKCVSLQSELETLSGELRVLHSQNESLMEAKQEAETRAVKFEEKLAGLSAEMKGKAESADDYHKKISDLKEEAETLTAQAKKAAEHEAAAKETVSELRKQLEEQVKQVDTLKEQVDKSKVATLEHQSLVHDLTRSKEREDLLRQQLQGSSKQIEDDNITIKQLKEKISSAEEELEKTQEELSSNTQCLKETKDAFNMKEKELSTVTEEKSELSSQLKSSERSVTRLESRLKARNGTIEELMTKMEEERKGFELALKDAKCNEVVIEELKKGLEEQEATMELQDQTIKHKEEELEALQKEYDQVIEKYQSMTEKSHGSNQEMRQLQREYNQLKRDIDRQASDAADSRRHLEDECNRLKKEIEKFTAKAEEQKLQKEQEIKRLTAEAEEHSREKQHVEAKFAAERNALVAELGELRSEQSRRETERQRAAHTERSEVQTLTSQLEQLQHEKLQSNKDKAQLEKEVKTANQELQQGNKDKTQLEKEVKTANQELQQMDKLLSESRKEIESLKCHKVELQQTCTAVEKEKQKNRDNEDTIQRLRQKFQRLEEQSSHHKEESLRWQQKLNDIENKKEEELTKWRNERDKLVSGLEMILKQKDSEIQQLKGQTQELKQNQAPTPRKNHEDIEKLVINLRAQLHDRDQTIAQLSEHLDQQSHTKHPRRGRKHQVCNNEDDENLRREVAILHTQLEQERAEHKHQLHKVVRAKDAIIDEMKDCNSRLQRNLHLSLTPVKLVEQSQDESILVADQGTSVMSPSHLTPQVPQRSTRGRRKRKSNELSEDGTTSARKTARSTRAKRKTAAKSTTDENAESSMLTAKDEPAGQLGSPFIRSSRLPMEDLMNRSTDGEKVLSPPQPAQATGRRRRLRSNMPEFFKDSPVENEQTAGQSDVHAIVTRRLRSRKN